MNRYFYKDALAAACMAKHFGMRFDNLKEVIEGVDGDTSLLALPRFVNDCRVGRRYFIHPDSLYQLEPKKYDLVDFGWIHPSGQSFHEMTLLSTTFKAFCGKSTCDYNSHRIIQRNGMAFHWPESEAA